MTIALPTSPLPKSATIRPVLFGGPLLADLGGEDQWLNRLGSRWELEVTTPRLKPEPDGRQWTSALAQAWFTGERVSFAVPQPGLAIGSPGAPVVNGGGQTGSSLFIRNFTPGYFLRVGQFFSIASGGRRYLHKVAGTGDFGADGLGLSSFPIQPMIRVSPTDGAVCEFLNPTIEGLLIGDERQWTQAPARTEPLRFVIRETR